MRKPATSRFAGAETVQYEKLADPPYNIALSNSYIGNVWRTQMIKMAKAYAESPDIAPLISEFQVNTADRDDAAQIAAIENMISNGAQALVILAHTPTALVQTVQQARADGIVVVSFDTTVQADPPDPSLDLGVTVNEDQVEMGRRWAQWLVEQTGGEGKILMVNGVQGTGVDQERREGAYEVWERAIPDIEPIEVVGDWDPGKAQTVDRDRAGGQSGLRRRLVPGRDRRRGARLHRRRRAAGAGGRRGRERLPQADAGDEGRVPGLLHRADARSGLPSRCARRSAC